MRTLAEKLRLPGWVHRVDPVAWFPVVALVVVAVLCVLAESLWLAFGALAAAGLIVVLEAMVFGTDWLIELQERRPAPPAGVDAPGMPAPRNGPPVASTPGRS